MNRVAHRRLRTPEERVGMLPNASLPPPANAEREVTFEDAQLLRALREHEERAFREVTDLYYPAMLRIALAHVESRATADEIIQETWMAALRGIARFEGRAAVKTWLFSILRNLARSRGKRDVRLRMFSDMAGPEGAADVPFMDRQTTAGRDAMWVQSSDPERQLLVRELGDELDRAIATLPARQREVLVLRDVEGWTGEEVCNAMGISQTNQRVMLHRARDRVRNEIRWYLDENGDCAENDRLDVS